MFKTRESPAVGHWLHPYSVLKRGQLGSVVMDNVGKRRQEIRVRVKRVSRRWEGGGGWGEGGCMVGERVVGCLLGLLIRYSSWWVGLVLETMLLNEMGLLSVGLSIYR